MFVSPADRSPLPAPDSATTRAGESLALLAERTRPVASSQTRLLPVLPPLVGLFPDGNLRRGSTIVVTGLTGGPSADAGSTGLTLALLAAASAAGSWCALVGMADLGAVAAHDLGVDLARLAVVPRPGPAWAEVSAALLEGVDVVVLRPPFPPRPAMARKLMARTRDRRAVLVVVPGRAGWPEHPDLHLHVAALRWDGIGTGEGFLSRRRMTVDATGRRSAVRTRHHQLWMPSATGTVAEVERAADDAPAPDR